MLHENPRVALIGTQEDRRIRFAWQNCAQLVKKLGWAGLQGEEPSGDINP
jgi:hypothetical protein